MLFRSNGPESELLAKTLQQNFRELLQPENKREAKSSGKEYYLLYTAKAPAVLVECGFLSSADEVSNLKDEEYQNKIAFVICKSVIDFYAAAGNSVGSDDSSGQSSQMESLSSDAASSGPSERQPDPPLSNGQVLLPDSSQAE